ncbi:MAG: hypothetical protein IKF47_00595 [Bacilli bacterium]|nr:hypothetical protein [Bacilli bacterium]
MKEKTLEKKDKKIVRNYIITIVLFIACCGLVLYLRELYRVNEAEQKKIPVIQGYISEIYSDDLEHYIMDNPNGVIYMCIANDENCRAFEREFKKLLKKDEYSDNLAYLNLIDVDQNEFLNNFNSKYIYKTKLSKEYPAFVLFEDGKVKAILQEKSKKLDIVKVKHFLELSEIGE